MARHSLTNSMRTHTNLERGAIKVLLVVRSPGGLAPKQQPELEAAATLQLEKIKIELGISDDVHVVYLKSRQSNIALPNVGHERQFGLKRLGEALVATQGTHLNVLALSYTGLTTDIGSLRSWCNQVAKQVESFNFGFYTQRNEIYKDYAEARTLESFRKSTKNEAAFLTMLDNTDLLGDQPLALGTLLHSLQEFFTVVNMGKAGGEGKAAPKNRHKPTQQDLDLLVEQMGAASMW
ncbi:hypothetical protein D6C99_06867 [Aureobasidium pullulans]|nr:hypothetical protein D6C99_06867 [Aureobasidium pullulans]